MVRCYLSRLLVHRDYEAKTVKAKVLKVKFQNLGTEWR